MCGVIEEEFELKKIKATRYNRVCAFDQVKLITRIDEDILWNILVNAGNKDSVIECNVQVNYNAFKK